MAWQSNSNAAVIASKTGHMHADRGNELDPS